MSRVRKRLVGSYFLALALVFIATPKAKSCSCTDWPTFDEAFTGSTSIFRGVVASIDPVGSDPSDDVLVHFTVSAWWRGFPRPEVALITPATGASCGYPFVVGSDYLVYALGTPVLPWTHLCWRTHLAWAEDPDLVSLGPPLPVAVVSETWGRIKRLFE